MKIWYEYETDVYRYYNYFNEKEENKRKMSVCSINASGINGKNIELFIENCNKHIIDILNNYMEVGYKLYIFCNIEISNPNSKVEHYNKVWKRVKKKFDIGKLILGEELLNRLGSSLFYTSIAEFSQDCIITAIKMAVSNPSRYALFISKSQNILSRKYIQNMFNNIISIDSHGKIDYYKFLLDIYEHEDIRLRYGTTFTDVELAFVYNSKRFNKRLF